MANNRVSKLMLKLGAGLAFVVFTTVLIPTDGAFADAPACSPAVTVCTGSTGSGNPTTCVDQKGSYCTDASQLFGTETCDASGNHIGTYTNPSNCTNQQSNCAQLTGTNQYYRTDRPCKIGDTKGNTTCVAQSNCANLQKCAQKKGGKTYYKLNYGCKLGSTAPNGDVCVKWSYCEYVRHDVRHYKTVVIRKRVGR